MSLDRDTVNIVVAIMVTDRSNLDFGNMLKDVIWDVRLVSKKWYEAFVRLYNGVMFKVGGRNIYVDLEIENIAMNLFD